MTARGAGASCSAPRCLGLPNVGHQHPKGRSNVYAMCCEALAGPVKLLATLAALTPEGADACCSE